jgi:chorismate dehydratase
VGSVLFYSKTDLKYAKPLRIAVSSASATSVNLLSVLLKEEYKTEPSFTYCPMPDLAAQEIDGALVIGDYALNVDPSWSTLSQRFDLAEWWTRLFNLPMVFAVWAARDDWQKLHRKQSDQIAESLKAALHEGLNSAFDQVIEEAAKRSGLPTSRLERYFRKELDFSFSSDHLAGLNRYKSLCEKHGLFGRALPDRLLQGVPLG